MYKCILIGCSAGSGQLISYLLNNISRDFVIPVIILRHIGQYNNRGDYTKILADETGLNIREPEDKELLEPSTIYFAPPGYHLLLNESNSFSLSLDERVNYNRPSVDILFESAVYAFGSEVIGIILSGANCDGAEGIKKIKECGGITIIQDPQTAEYPTMPESAINLTDVDYICSIENINQLILDFNNL